MATIADVVRAVVVVQEVHLVHQVLVIFVHKHVKNLVAQLVTIFAIINVLQLVMVFVPPVIVILLEHAQLVT